MVGEIFYWVFNMSITATICTGIILLLRCFKKIPRRFFVILWAVPFLRFLIPFGPVAKYNLVSLITFFTGKNVKFYSPDNLPDFSAINSLTSAKDYFPIVYKKEIFERIYNISGTVWLIVSSALIICFFVIYFITMKEVKSALHLRDNVYLSDKVSSPALYGIIKPKIIIPPSFKDANLEYIILHENTHLKRRDNLFRVLAFFGAALHWFNPFSWLFLKTYFTDLELACDEEVISKLGEDEKKIYAHTLVSSLERTNVFASTFGGAKIKLRVENIISYKKLSLGGAVALCLFLAAVCYFLLTNAL